MHTDVIVSGSGIPAVLAGLLFARRGFRTLVLQPDAAPAMPAVSLLQADVAGSVKFAIPREGAVWLDSLNLELWGAGERRTVAIRGLPFLVLNSAAYLDFLEREAAATRNFKLLRGYEAVSLSVKQGFVRGVDVRGGQTVEARLVVDCGVPGGGTVPGTEALWLFPASAAFRGTAASEERRIGPSASAWSMGTMACRLLAGKGVSWHLRFAPDRVESGAAAIQGSPLNAPRQSRRFFDEAGLVENGKGAAFAGPCHLGPPLPVAVAGGYVAVDRAAGQGNPFMPADLSVAVAGVFLAHAAAAHALEEGDTSAEALWPYSRSFARQWAPSQAYTWAMVSGLLALSPVTFDSVLKPGMLDGYALACLIRNRPIDEETVDRVSSLVRSVLKPGGYVAWRRLIGRAADLARVYSDVPNEWNPKNLARWQQTVVDAWRQR